MKIRLVEGKLSFHMLASVGDMEEGKGCRVDRVAVAG